MPIKTMHDLVVEELREILDAEKQATKAYPKLMKVASSERLKQALEQHNEETKGQIERLNRIFEDLDMRSRGKPCEALRGVVEDAQDLIDRGLAPALLDVALIAAAQKMEHFEIAAYGSACAHAEAMKLGKAVELLNQTLEQEKAMDRKLNDIAINEVNPKAIEPEAEEEGARIERAAAGDKPKPRGKSS